jgi:hypothetical protein
MVKGKVKTMAPKDVIFLDLSPNWERYCAIDPRGYTVQRLLTMDLVTDDTIGSLGT